MDPDLDRAAAMTKKDLVVIGNGMVGHKFPMDARRPLLLRALDELHAARSVA